jgi:uncharacterized protein (DUF2141 family)
MRLRSAAFLQVALFILLSCAQQTTPTGGPKDERPPRLIRSSPDSSQRNFSGKTIELTFNEMLQLNNPKEEIIITPSLGKKTQFKLKDNRVTIEPELPFRENTTYTLNFREGIKDATEGNVAEGLRLAFSTGPLLDTLLIQGTVTSASSEKIPENVTVGIYSADTFNIFQHSPEYFTKSAKKTGAFQITNLKAGTYRIYAFEDKNKNLKVESQSEAFGFLSASIVLEKNVSKVSIPITKVDSRPLKLLSVRAQSNVNTIRFNKGLTSYNITAPQYILSHYGSTQAEVIAYHPEPPESTVVDSLSVQISASDSLAQRIDTTIFIHKSAREKIEERFRTTLTEPLFNVDTKEFEFKVSYNKPLKSFIKDSLYLLSDSSTIIPISLTRALIDTAHNELSFREKLQLRDSLVAPTLHFGLGAMISIDNDSSAALNRDVTVLTQATTATVLVQVETRQKNYIIQLLDAQDKVVASAVNDPKPVFRYLKPQTVKLRAIIDTNGNGKWDTINYFTNTEAERIVYYLTLDKKYDTPLRVNWEVGPLVLRF